MASYIHLVWPTKHRQVILTPAYKFMVVSCMYQIASEKGIIIHALDGHLDHIHVLVELGHRQRIEWVVRMLKGGTSFWINNIAKIRPKLYWAVGYHWTSVAPAGLPTVRMYIENQERHHGKKG